MAKRRPTGAGTVRPLPTKPVREPVPLIVRIEREVEEDFRPRMRAELERRIHSLPEAKATTPVNCEGCGRTMESAGVAKVGRLCRFGQITIKVRKHRCRRCRQSRRTLLAALGIEAGRVTGSLVRLLALLGTIVPYDLAAFLACEMFGVDVDAMCVWRCTQRLGEAAAVEDEALAQFHASPGSDAPVAPKAPRVVVAGFDGCMLGVQPRTKRRRRKTADEVLPPLPPIEDERWREVKTGVLLAAEERVETSPGRRSVVQRHLVTCLGDAGAVYSRLWAKLCELGWHGPQTLVVVIGDGAEWIWNRADMFVNRVEVLDFWHAIEKAWEFARVRHGEGSKASDRWIHKLAEDLRAGRVETVVARLLKLKVATRQQREKLDALIRYYTGNASRMRYDEYLRLGYGIGSGAIESAHKQVVHARLRQAGMRWSQAGARRLLALRLRLLSKDWRSLDSVRLARVA
jgi:hypothetical protein